MLYYIQMDTQLPIDGERRRVADLRHPDWNPRRISEFDFTNLEQSMLQFGPLDCIVKNICSGNLVGGNQRTKVLEKHGVTDLTITWHTSETPDPAGPGTLAYGYALLNGERFTYREVYWPLDAVDPATGEQFSSKEKAANIAANYIQGDWDREKLAQVTYQIAAFDPNVLRLSGMPDSEVNTLLSAVSGSVLMPAGQDLTGEPGEITPAIPGTEQSQSKKRQDDGMQRLQVKLTDHQLARIYDAIAKMKSERTLTNEPNNDMDGAALYYICEAYTNAPAADTAG